MAQEPLRPLGWHHLPGRHICSKCLCAFPIPAVIGKMVDWGTVHDCRSVPAHLWSNLRSKAHTPVTPLCLSVVHDCRSVPAHLWSNLRSKAHKPVTPLC
eukprot:1153253-Pelagomonas_calceolata.AAC.1